MAEFVTDLDAVEQGLTPKAVVDQVHRNTQAGQTAPELQSTGRVTFGHGQPTSGNTIPGRKSPWPMVGATAVVLVLAGVGYVAFGSRTPETPTNVVQPAAAAATQPAVPVPAPAATPAITPVPAPAAPAQLTISSEPSGAELYRNGALVGTTPVTLDKPKADERVDLELRANRYQSKTFSISSLTDDELKVTLRAQPKAVSRRPAAPPKPVEQKPEKPSKPKPKRGVESEVLDPWD